MNDADPRLFRAYASRKQALVVLAAFLPMLVLFTWNLPLHPDMPVAGRIIGALLVMPVAAMVVAPLRTLFASGPVLEISSSGIFWRSWSPQPIPWSAVERWSVKRMLGVNFVTLWLKEPEAHRSNTVMGWLQRPNRWMGFGDIAIGSGGMNRSFKQLATAITDLAPSPADPRLARR
jgi:hypothetical protein